MKTDSNHHNVITIQGEEAIIPITFEAVEAYHGHQALAMLAITYQGLRGALALLADHPLSRANLTVVSGHPGPGVRDAFEFVTRAVTRGVYTVDLSLPEARYCNKKDKSYSFFLCGNNKKVQAILKPGILPARFFALLGSADQADQKEHQQLRREIANRVIQLQPDEIFDFKLITA